MVTNLIFDFGNVLFDIDLFAFEREMKQALGNDFDAISQTLRNERFFEHYETGGLSTEEFLGKLCLATHNRISETQVVNAWNAILLGMPQHRFELLSTLRQRYKVFLLSNINDLHEHWIADYMLRQHALPDYETRFFDGVYFSHLVRLRKPSLEVFEYVLADAELLPEQTVFFDDLPENVDAAKQAGIQGIWHQPGTEIALRLVEMGLVQGTKR